MAQAPFQVLESPEKLQAPHAVAAEQSLLGALLVNNEAWDEIDGKIRAEHFYDRRHQVLFTAAYKLFSEKYADIVLLIQELKNSNTLDAAGGESYIADLAAIGAAPANMPAYAEEIKKTAQMRQILLVLGEVNARVLRPGGSSPREILDEAGAKLNSIDEDAAGAGMSSVAKKAHDFFDHLTDIVNKQEFFRLLGEPTGFSTLDKMTTGLHGGDLVIIAGRPGSGKSAFALNIIRHMSVNGEGVLVFSLEMSDQQLVMRLLSQDHIDMQTLRTGKDRKGNPMNTDNLRRFSEAVSEMENRDIFIDDSGVLTVLEAKIRARRVAQQMARQGKKLGMVVVDYLQLLSASATDSGENRANEVAVISRGLKALAKELDVPVLALSQLNRSAKERAAKEPLLSDLRESGAIEQDADIVMFLHEKNGDEPDYSAPPEEGTPVKLIIGKQRNGPTGKINLQFQKQFSRFAEVAREEETPSGSNFG